MNKVYGLMSVAMMITGAVAWAVGTDCDAPTAGEPTGIIPAGVLQAMSILALKWVIMFAPLTMVFALRRRDQPHVGRCGAAVLLRLRRGDGPVARLDLPGLHRRVDRADLLRDRDRLRGPRRSTATPPRRTCRAWARS